MGAFNIVTGKTVCPICKREILTEIQFKYGDTWQYHYSIGDYLKWGGNDIGSPQYLKVIVKGEAGPCPHCNSDAFECEIEIVSNQIIGINSGDSNDTKLNRKNFKNGFLIIQD